MRDAEIKRKSNETDIELFLDIDGSGETDIETGVGFFDHMLDAMCRFGQLDLRLVCRGDLNVDAHHTVEDVGICLGKALKEALGTAWASAGQDLPTCRWTRHLVLRRSISAAGRTLCFRRNLYSLPAA